ncbi:MAG: dTDP-4-dehydrorhamnose 3,5-epimerase [Pseudomonadota bacterium]
MKLLRTDIPDVLIVEPAVYGDDRGWFTESYNARAFAAGIVALGLPQPPELVQDNHSCSRAGVLRGLHYQLPPHAQAKLVRVVQGRAWDVAVDIRPASPTYGRWVGVELTPANRRQLWIPAGFAHGFVALEDDTHFLYKTSDYYAKDCERALRWDDPALAIAWPLPADLAPLLAAKDAAAPLLREVAPVDLPPA